MESLKPILLLVVLSGVGYGVYVALNHAPPSESAPGNSSHWNKPVGGEPGTTNNSAAAQQQPGAASATRNNPTPQASATSPASGLDKLNRLSESGPNPAPSAGSPPIANPGISLPFGIGSSAMQPPASSAAPMPAETPLAASAVLPADRSANAGLAPVQSSPDQADAVARIEFSASVRTAQSLAGQGKLVEALREISRWYNHPAVPPEEQPKLVEMLGQLAGTVIYSRQHWLSAPYTVQSGDTLENIAQQCDVPWQLLAKINGIGDPNSLAPGEELKIVRGPFTAQLNCQQDCLTLFLDGMFAGRFQVQGGRTLMKPEGKYAVAKFRADDPSNVTRRPYISLGGDLQLRVPDDVGVQSPGIVGISQSDLNDVFDMLSSRSEVTIRR
jgi:hypothetical protein